jgi:hypothetical protein
MVEKFTLEERVKAKDKEILTLTTALTAEQTKVQAYAAEKKSLKTLNAQSNNDIVELKWKLKDEETVVAHQTAEIAELTAALKAEKEKVADLQTQLDRKTQFNITAETVIKTGDKAATAPAVEVPEPAAAGGKPETEGRRRSILNFFI